MIVLIGASASGKTELLKCLRATFGYQKCVTTTTRSMRKNELQGIDYHFINKEEFIIKQLANEFIGITKYQNNYYGIHQNDVSLNSIVIVDPKGANELIDVYGDQVFTVYLETSEDLRRIRMIERGDELEKITSRIESDRFIFKPSEIKKLDLMLENEDTTLSNLAEIVHKSYQKYLRFKRLNAVYSI